MKKAILAVLGFGLCITGASLLRGAEHGHDHGPPACEPGYTVVKEVVYKEVVRKVCREVCDVKKVTKWVYDCKTENFCLKQCRPGHKCSEDCASCKGPYQKNLLIKRMVVEEHPTTKCVVEEVVERVPCVVYRKVPCAAVPSPK